MTRLRIVQLGCILLLLALQPVVAYRQDPKKAAADPSKSGKDPSNNVVDKWGAGFTSSQVMHSNDVRAIDSRHTGLSKPQMHLDSARYASRPADHLLTVKGIHSNGKPAAYVADAHADGYYGSDVAPSKPVKNLDNIGGPGKGPKP